MPLEPIGRLGAGHGNLARLRRGRHDLSDHLIEAIEERCAEHEPGRHILAGHRQQPTLDLLRVQGRVVIDAIGIGLQHRAGIGRKGRVVVGGHGVAHFQQPHQIVRHRRLRALDACQLAARDQRRILDGGEIVLGMRKTQPERDVRISRGR